MTEAGGIFGLLTNRLCGIVLISSLVVLLTRTATCHRHDFPSETLEVFEPEAYSKALERIRAIVGQFATEQHDSGIPILKTFKKIAEAKRFILVNLGEGNRKITVALDSSNLYFVGYGKGDDFYYFNDVDALKAARENLFDYKNSKKQHDIGSSNYERMEPRDNKIGMENVEVGIHNLQNAAETMFKNPGGFTGGRDGKINHYKALIVCIEMISEALRFGYIENEMKARAYQGKKPDNRAINLAKNWSKISQVVKKTKSPTADLKESIALGNGDVIKTLPQLKEIADMRFILP